MFHPTSTPHKTGENTP
ncbi:rCG58215, partial [Rattus norvegicus]